MAKGNYTNKAAQNVADFMNEKASGTVRETPRKAGRPKKGDVRKISLAIPVELYDGVEFGSYFFRGNITAYINSLIRRDLEKNLGKYQEFKAMMEEINKTM